MRATPGAAPDESLMADSGRIVAICSVKPQGQHRANGAEPDAAR
jgi:hypothetical protein